MINQSKDEIKFRKKHYAHILEIKETPNSIVTGIDIRCVTCNTEYIDVSDYDNW